MIKEYRSWIYFKNVIFVRLSSPAISDYLKSCIQMLKWLVLGISQCHCWWCNSHTLRIINMEPPQILRVSQVPLRIKSGQFYHLLEDLKKHLCKRDLKICIFFTSLLTRKLISYRIISMEPLALSRFFFIGTHYFLN